MCGSISHRHAHRYPPAQHAQPRPGNFCRVAHPAKIEAYPTSSKRIPHELDPAHRKNIQPQIETNPRHLNTPLDVKGQKTNPRFPPLQALYSCVLPASRVSEPGSTNRFYFTTYHWTTNLSQPLYTASTSAYVAPASSACPPTDPHGPPK